jgi:hypothetical protein
MSSLGKRVAWDSLRSRDGATFNGAYQKLGGPFEHDCFLVKIVNQSGSDVVVSLDGVTDIDICPAGSYFLYDETSNASREGGMVVAKWTQFWVKGTATVGYVYLVTQYSAT